MPDNQETALSTQCTLESLEFHPLGKRSVLILFHDHPDLASIGFRSMQVTRRNGVPTRKVGAAKAPSLSCCNSCISV